MKTRWLLILVLIEMCLGAQTTAYAVVKATYPEILTPDGVKQNLTVASERIIALDAAEGSSEIKAFVQSITSIENIPLRREARLNAIEYALRWDAPRRYLILYYLGLNQPEEDFQSYVAELQHVLVDIVANEQYRYGYRPEAGSHADLDPSTFSGIAMAMVDSAIDRAASEKVRIALIEDLLVVFARNVPVESPLSRVILGGIEQPTLHPVREGAAAFYTVQRVVPETSLIGQWIPKVQRGALRNSLQDALDEQNRDSELLAVHLVVGNVIHRVKRIEDDLQHLRLRMEQGFQELRDEMKGIHEELDRLKLLPIELSQLWDLHPPDDMGSSAFTVIQETALLKDYAPFYIFDRSEYPDCLEVLVKPSYFLNEQNGARRRNGPTGNKERSALAGIRNGDGVFGLVQPLGSSLLSLQYYLLFAFNNAAWDEYHHEGDWSCVELLIFRESDASKRPPVYAMFVHNHGPIIKAAPRAIQWQTGYQHRPRIYLEAGSNEPWPVPGDSGDIHDGTPGLERRGGYAWTNIGAKGFSLNPFSWFGSDFGPDIRIGPEGVRPHNGTGEGMEPPLVLDAATNLINVRDPIDTEAGHVRDHSDKWGGSADSPKSPLYNPKMRQRKF